VSIEPGPQFVERHFDDPYQQDAVFGARRRLRPDDFSERTGLGMVHMNRTMDRHRVVSYPFEDFDSTGAQMDGQMTSISSSPATHWKVETLGVLPGHEHLVAPLLGLAAEHSLRTSGRLPDASHDLSAYSGRLVGKLAQRGLVTDPRGNGSYSHNSIDRSGAKTLVDNSDIDGSFEESNVTRITGRRVTRAANFTRGMLRASRPPKPQQEPEQGSLW
jgi:hypothetical protein